jgi:hypothetical protein
MLQNQWTPSGEKDAPTLVEDKEGKPKHPAPWRNVKSDKKNIHSKLGNEKEAERNRAAPGQKVK